MATKVKAPKSQEWAKELKEQMTVNKNGVIETPPDFYEETLKDVGVTLEQLKALQEHNAQLLPAAGMAGAEVAHKHFQEHPDAQEVRLDYSMGHDQQSIIYSRGDTSPMREVLTVHGHGDEGELHRVHEWVDNLFDDL